MILKNPSLFIVRTDRQALAQYAPSTLFEKVEGAYCFGGIKPKLTYPLTKW